MATYVDEIRYYFWRPHGSFLWCHLFADTEEELHEMARRLHLSRDYFQARRYPHYDLTPIRRAYARKLGAKETTTRSWVRRHWGEVIAHEFRNGGSP